MPRLLIYSFGYADCGKAATACPNTRIFGEDCAGSFASQWGDQPADVFIALLEIPPEKLSFGEGRAVSRETSDTSNEGELLTMTRKAISSDKLPAPVIPISLAVHGGPLLYLSGQVAQDPVTGKLIDGDVAQQTDQILRNIATALQAAGKDLNDVVRVGVYLTDMADFAAMNEVYAKHFTEPYPARTAIGVAALPLGAVVEMDAVIS
jgi:2-iminobutanoate/2-iminopropanoate deaminase